MEAWSAGDETTNTRSLTRPDPLPKMWAQTRIVWNPVWDWLDEEDVPREQVGVMGSPGSQGVELGRR